MAKKSKKVDALAREERLKAEDAAKAAAAEAAAQAAAEEARLAEERRAAKAEARKKSKRPRFVREATPKVGTPKPKAKPLPERGTGLRAKLMTKNIALAPKDERPTDGRFR